MLEKGKVTTIYGNYQSGRTAIASSLMSGKRSLYITDYVTPLDRIPKDALVERFGSLEDIQKIRKLISHYLGIDLIVIDSISQVYRLTRSPKIFSSFIEELSTKAKSLNMSILLIADTYEDFQTKETKISSGGVLKVASDILINVEKRGPKRIIEFKRPSEKEIEFKIVGGKAIW